MEITEASFYLDSNFISTTSMIMKSLDCPTIEGVYKAAKEAAEAAYKGETNLEKDEDNESLYHLVEGVALLNFYFIHSMDIQKYQHIRQIAEDFIPALSELYDEDAKVNNNEEEEEDDQDDNDDNDDDDRETLLLEDAIGCFEWVFENCKKGTNLFHEGMAVRALVLLGVAYFARYEGYINEKSKCKSNWDEQKDCAADAHLFFNTAIEKSTSVIIRGVPEQASLKVMLEFSSLLRAEAGANLLNRMLMKSSQGDILDVHHKADIVETWTGLAYLKICDARTLLKMMTATKNAAQYAEIEMGRLASLETLVHEEN